MVVGDSAGLSTSDVEAVGAFSDVWASCCVSSVSAKIAKRPKIRINTMTAHA